MAVVLKVKCGTELHRLLWDKANLRFESICQAVNNLHHVENFVIQYLDGDNKACILTQIAFSDFLKNAADRNGKQVLKIEVLKVPQHENVIGPNALECVKAPRESEIGQKVAEDENGEEASSLAREIEEVESAAATREVKLNFDEKPNCENDGMFRTASHLAAAGLGSVDVLVDLLKDHDCSVERTLATLLTVRDSVDSSSSEERRHLIFEAAEKRRQSAPGVSTQQLSQLNERRQKEELLGKLAEHYRRMRTEMPMGLNAATVVQLRAHLGRLRHKEGETLEEKLLRIDEHV